MSTDSQSAIASVDEFHGAVRIAMELSRQLDGIDAVEARAKSRAASLADAKRSAILPQYEALMSRIMGFISARHPEVLKGGDRAEFETDELIVRMHRDGNGTLEVDNDDAFIKYLWARPELRHLVRVVKKFVGAAEFKKWLRDNPGKRPPAGVVYKDSIILLTKQTSAQKRRGSKPAVLKREIRRR